MRPLGLLEDEEAVDEPAAPLASIREERDLRLIGDELEGASEALGELCLVLGAMPAAAQDSRAIGGAAGAAGGAGIGYGLGGTKGAIIDRKSVV